MSLRAYLLPDWLFKSPTSVDDDGLPAALPARDKDNARRQESVLPAQSWETPESYMARLALVEQGVAPQETRTPDALHPPAALARLIMESTVEKQN